MRRISFSLLLGVLAVSLMGMRLEAKQADSASYLSPRHRLILKQWLLGKPRLRLATEADCKNREGLDAMRQEFGPSYHPYYLVRDFNRDGHEDFAVVLVNKQRRARKFVIVIFNGPLDTSRSSTPAFYVEGIDLSDGGLSISRDENLVAGVFQTDNCVILRPRGKGYVMNDCL